MRGDRVNVMLEIPAGIPLPFEAPPVREVGAAVPAERAYELPGRFGELLRSAGDAVPAWLVALTATLLHRYTQQRELAVLVDGAPVRVPVAPDDTARRVAARLAGAAGAAGAASDLPQATGVLRFGFALDTLDREPPRVVLRYLPDRLAPAQVDRVAGHLRRLAESIATHPDARLDSLELLTGAELRWLATGGTPRPESDHRLLAFQLVEAQAARTPDAVALVERSSRHTYGRLVTDARRWAAALADASVRPGEVVAVYGERSAETVAGLLGALQAGAAYLPLDPTYPAARLAHMLADSGAGIVLTQRHLRDRLPPGGRGIVTLTAADLPPAGPVPDPATAVPPESPAYLLYTSGSTGRPKGTVVPHRALTALLAEFGARLGLAPSDTVLAQTPMSFDISIVELLLPLTVGASIHLVDRATAADGHALTAELERVRPTLIQGTPTTLRMLVAAGWSGDQAATVLAGGEPLPPDLAEHIGRRCRRLWNGYGPTETAVYSVAGPVEPSGPVTIGTPVPGDRAYVLDRAGNQLPVGVPGELHIGGLGLAHGYLGRPDLTAERFVPDPFDGRPGSRMYRTGDLVRWRDDGRIDFLGRLDQQVKLRGYRIEPGEIEAALRGHPAVRDAVVGPATGNGREPVLRAHLLLAEGAEEPDRVALRAHCGLTLPEFMVPAVFLVVDAFPRTPSGKVDRAALAGGRPLPPARVAGPATPVERVVLEVWRDAIGAEDLSVAESVFAAGADSLVAMRTAAVLSGVFRSPVSVRNLFERPTVREQAAYLSDLDGNTAQTIADRLLQLASRTRTPKGEAHAESSRLVAP
jgi:amino acid adenylation domain-containing protein